jgi:hypothetical protein
MRVWCDVYSPTTGLKELGPVTLVSARTSKALDAAGSFQVTGKLSDPRARALLQEFRTLDLWGQLGATKRLYMTGIITSVRINTSDDTLTASGSDLTETLRRENTLFGRVFNGSFTSAVQTLASLGGWSVSVSGAWGNVSLQFDGESALTALLATAQSVGAHVRVGNGIQTLDIGAFGEVVNALATNITINTGEIAQNARLLLIDNLQIDSKSDKIVNWLIPFAGSGANAVSLQYATVSGVVSLTGPNGQLQYYITEQASINQYGVTVKQTKSFSNVKLVTMDTAGRQAASNNLLSAAKAWLTRNAYQTVIYRMTCRKNETEILPGDRIRVFYSSRKKDDGGNDNVSLQVDNTLYVTEINETLGETDQTEFVLSTSDIRPDTPERSIANNIKDTRDDRARQFLSS